MQKCVPRLVIPFQQFSYTLFKLRSWRQNKKIVEKKKYKRTLLLKFITKTNLNTLFYILSIKGNEALEF